MEVKSSQSWYHGGGQVNTVREPYKKSFHHSVSNTVTVKSSPCRYHDGTQVITV